MGFDPQGSLVVALTVGSQVIVHVLVVLDLDPRKFLHSVGVDILDVDVEGRSVSLVD
jgi:hypothetical protein